MYHLELRKFPHVVCRFNQSEAQLRALVVPWTRQEWIEEGERKWNVNEATLTILEGPKLSMPDLAMGKGWRNAQKRSQDVTERVLGAAQKIGEVQREQHGGASPGVVAAREDAGTREGTGTSESAGMAEGAGAGAAQLAGPGEAPRERAEARELDLLADSLGLELLALLDGGPVAPSRVWSMAQERLGERGSAASAAEALALAEGAVGSLLGRGLAVLRGDGRGEDDLPRGSDEQAGEGTQAGDDRPAIEVIARERHEAVLAAIETWAGGGRQPVVIARKV